MEEIKTKEKQYNSKGQEVKTVRLTYSDFIPIYAIKDIGAWAFKSLKKKKNKHSNLTKLKMEDK